jgi:hypothetical protein
MLCETFLLPEGWSEPEILEDAVVADGVELRRAGVSSRGPSGEEIVGSAVDAKGSPIDRSYFELLERVSTVEALRARRSAYELRTVDEELIGVRTADQVFPESDDPARWRYARSNGVALHADWTSAALRAYWELAERDRVLRAWCGETRPQPLELDVDATVLRHSRSYEWLAASFPDAGSADFSHGVAVVGVFGIPTRTDLPLISGYGARPLVREALDAAVCEATQFLGFLWGEPPLDRLPDPAPTPNHHLEYFQWPLHRDIFRRWIDEGHGRFRPSSPESLASRGRDASSAPAVAFVDLTPAWLGGGLRVAKAICDGATRLAFGEAPFARHLPAELRVHPIA